MKVKNETATAGEHNEQKSAPIGTAAFWGETKKGRQRKHLDDVCSTVGRWKTKRTTENTGADAELVNPKLR